LTPFKKKKTDQLYGPPYSYKSHICSIVAIL
jgi:hypothetical protein